MSLVLEGFALAIEAGGLIIDCACCIGEKCDLRACLTEIDCTDAGGPNADCYCRGNQCVDDPSCTDDDDCPDGLVCINGECLSPCRGQECTGNADCPEECICVDGGCFDPNSIYYCHGDPDDSLADGQCAKGVPEVSKGGPYLSIGLCAQSGCKSKFSCNPVLGDCYPDAAGNFEDLPTCQMNCGGGGDQGRCCKSVVCYDADGEVISVVQGEADCCPSCTKDRCISDLPQEPPYCRTFRQFNSLFDNCDLCATIDIGPCCHLDENDKQVCSMVDRGECENVLNGEWKGNNWFDCENARDPDVDLLLDFACPDCNGQGDCSCEDGEFCFANRCNSCQNPNTNPTKTGAVTEVRSDNYTVIDGDPRVYRKYYFRVLTCPGQNLDQVKNEPVNIYGKLVGDDVYTLLLTVDNRDVDSLGYTTYDDDECYTEIVARKADGTPSRIGLCYFWQDPPISRPNCLPVISECYCFAGDEFVEATNPVGATVNCNQPDGIDMINESWDWVRITPQSANIPIVDINYTVNGCSEKLYADSTGFWMREIYSYLWSGDCDSSVYTYEEDRYIAALPDGSTADVTDEWFTPLPRGKYENSLIRTTHYVCDECNEDGDCTVDRQCVGSFCENILELTPPMEKPDPLMTCDPIRIKLTSPNPLP